MGQYCIHWKISAYAYFPKGVRRRCLFFNGCLFLNSLTPKKAYLRLYQAKKNGSPIKLYSILKGILIGAYFPCQTYCKAHGRLFSMGAHFFDRSLFFSKYNTKFEQCAQENTTFWTKKNAFPSVKLVNKVNECNKNSVYDVL